MIISKRKYGRWPRITNALGCSNCSSQVYLWFWLSWSLHLKASLRRVTTLSNNSLSLRSKLSNTVPSTACWLLTTLALLKLILLADIEYIPPNASGNIFKYHIINHAYTSWYINNMITSKIDYWNMGIHTLIRTCSDKVSFTISQQIFQQSSSFFSSLYTRYH